MSMVVTTGFMILSLYSTTRRIVIHASVPLLPKRTLSTLGSAAIIFGKLELIFLRGSKA